MLLTVSLFVTLARLMCTSARNTSSDESGKLLRTLGFRANANTQTSWYVKPKSYRCCTRSVLNESSSFAGLCERTTSDLDVCRTYLRQCQNHTIKSWIDACAPPAPATDLSFAVTAPFVARMIQVRRQ
ncbi:hypothetical protein C8Q72DRAFT_259937 [Fomitopsis betulina]|nr:hypothetical protein C8Q72DRAFT_259937 [Fomitopsis betulina]